MTGEWVNRCLDCDSYYHENRCPYCMRSTLADLDAFLRSSAISLRVWYAHHIWHAMIGVYTVEGETMIKAIRGVLAQALKVKQ